MREFKKVLSLQYKQTYPILLISLVVSAFITSPTSLGCRNSFQKIDPAAQMIDRYRKKWPSRLGERFPNRDFAQPYLDPYQINQWYRGYSTPHGSLSDLIAFILGDPFRGPLAWNLSHSIDHLNQGQEAATRENLNQAYRKLVDQIKTRIHGQSDFWEMGDRFAQQSWLDERSLYKEADALAFSAGIEIPIYYARKWLEKNLARDGRPNRRQKHFATIIEIQEQKPRGYHCYLSDLEYHVPGLILPGDLRSVYVGFPMRTVSPLFRSDRGGPREAKDIDWYRIDVDRNPSKILTIYKVAEMSATREQRQRFKELEKVFEFKPGGPIPPLRKTVQEEYPLLKRLVDEFREVSQ